ncbi:phosphopantetheine-binding protein [Flexibacterium corallicola]|uniref:phosphopantetheine-binding protein n=1 Tax=Flexibacterium corallicola TaxID=3037259 RepID=UPI00286F723D|nr:phosphopantetheine-binding protein [Pseudovibrio sp. M1P-2-3]
MPSTLQDREDPSSSPTPDVQERGANAPASVQLQLDGLIDLVALRTSLKRSLPDYMVPSQFVGLSCLPLMLSGKVDRKALPDVSGEVVQSRFIAPANATEQLVASIFSELLGVEQVGREDNFFALGGHSLRAVQLVTRLQAATGKAVTVRDVFEAPTVIDLSAYLDHTLLATEQVFWYKRTGLSRCHCRSNRNACGFWTRLDSRAGAALPH